MNQKTIHGATISLEFSIISFTHVCFTASILPESQVVTLGGLSTLNRGDTIYAVYPDTTSFYQATVVEMTKKVQGKDPLDLVHFKDDGDEHVIQ